MLTQPDPELARWMGLSAEFLRRCDIDRVGPEDALHAAAQLRARVAPAALELTWQRRLPGDGLRYDLHVHDASGTFSMGYSSDTETPWALHRAEPWTDQHVVSVNGELVDIETVFSKLDFVWGDTGLLMRLVDDSLVNQAIQRLGLSLDTAGSERALRTFLARRGLEDPAVLASWLAQRGMSSQKLQQHAAALALLEQLKRTVVADQERPYFDRHREDFESWSIFTLSGCTQDDLEVIARAWEAFGPLQWLCSSMDVGGPRLPLGAEVRVRRAFRRDAQTARHRFEQRGGVRLRGPSRVGGTLELSCLLGRTEAHYDEAVAAACREAVFRDWLAVERRSAKVEWFWGPAS